jgi:hypothetical protein
MYTMALLVYQISVTRRQKQTFCVPVRIHHKRKYFDKTVLLMLEIGERHSRAFEEVRTQMQCESHSARASTDLHGCSPLLFLSLGNLLCETGLSPDMKQINRMWWPVTHFQCSSELVLFAWTARTKLMTESSNVCHVSDICHFLCLLLSCRWIWRRPRKRARHSPECLCLYVVIFFLLLANVDCEIIFSFAIDQYKETLHAWTDDEAGEESRWMDGTTRSTSRDDGEQGR